MNDKYLRPAGHCRALALALALVTVPWGRGRRAVDPKTEMKRTSEAGRHCYGVRRRIFGSERTTSWGLYDSRGTAEGDNCGFRSVPGDAAAHSDRPRRPVAMRRHAAVAALHVLPWLRRQGDCAGSCWPAGVGGLDCPPSCSCDRFPSGGPRRDARARSAGARHRVPLASCRSDGSGVFRCVGGRHLADGRGARGAGRRIVLDAGGCTGRRIPLCRAGHGLMARTPEWIHDDRSVLRRGSG
jgi:hypothetical protein